MKKLLPVLLVLISAAVFGQSVETKIGKFERASSYAVYHNKTTGETSVNSPTGWVKPPRSNIVTYMTLTIPAAGSKENARIDLFFERDAFDWFFTTSHHLEMLADDAKIDLGDGTRTTRESKLFDAVEIMTYRLTPVQLTALGNAKAIKLKMGPFDGTLDDETIRVMKNLSTLLK